MLVGCDTGGTFTDLAIVRNGRTSIFKAPTTPSRPVDGIVATLELASARFGVTLSALLQEVVAFVHGTTHPLNAVITGTTARTALIVTKGHRDILKLREGGRADPFDKTVPFPRPFIPRSLTFEVTERIGFDGAVRTPLDPQDLDVVVERLKVEKVQAVAVALLWSIRNPAHEAAILARLNEALPDVAVSLSSDVNPIIREFRRASSTALDAALKPFVSRYVDELEQVLRGKGLVAPLFLVGSDGALMAPDQAKSRPVALLNSGPALAPFGAMISGASLLGAHEDLITCDAGGTTFDVSVIEKRKVRTSSENWVGGSSTGTFCGYPSVEVLSVGAGGGGIAAVDPFGLLKVGPRSAGAVPGPVCYGKGGMEPTVTDAALLRGILNPKRILGGRLSVDPAAAETAVKERIAAPLRLTTEDAVLTIMNLVTDKMVHAIEDAAQARGVDPARCTLVSAGGATGLNIIDIARSLGVRRVFCPSPGAALSAFGMATVEPSGESRQVFPIRSDAFDAQKATSIVDGLRRQARARIPNVLAQDAPVSYVESVEARYEGQVWDIEVELGAREAGQPIDADRLKAAFGARHLAIFGHQNASLQVDFITWRVRASASLPGRVAGCASAGTREVGLSSRAVLNGRGEWHTIPVVSIDDDCADYSACGPAVIETDYMTLHVSGADRFHIASGNVLVEVSGSASEGGQA